MSYNSLFMSRKNVFPFYDYLGKMDFIKININPNGKTWNASHKGAVLANKEYGSLAKSVIDSGISNILDCFLTYNVIHHGPKIFRPTQLDFECLSHFNLTIPFDDYVQPYPTVIVELPHSYYDKRIVGCEQAGMDGLPDKHTVDMVILYHNPSWICAGAIFTSGQMYNLLLWKYQGMEVLEDIFQSYASAPRFDKSLGINDAEHNVALEAIKAALNAMIIIEDIGHSSLKPDNQKHHDKLVKYKRNAVHKDEKSFSIAELELKTSSMVFGFNQEVKLFGTESINDGRQRLGGTVEPHWRSGHYRMQHYGPGNEMTKRIRINPIIVNKHLFFGDAKDIMVVYK